MDTQEAIATRRMEPKVETEPISRSSIEALLEAAVRAPNHHLTEPWRFLVLKGKGLDDLGEAMADRLRPHGADGTGGPELDHKIEVERSRAHRAPVIIVAVYSPSTDPKAIEVEDRYSVGAAVQNILLSAHASGLGAYWRTGPAALAPSVKTFLDLEPSEEIAGFIYVGKPSGEHEREPTRRTPSNQKTSWIGWEQ